MSVEAGLQTVQDYVAALYPNRAIDVQPDPERPGVWLYRAEGEPFLLAVTDDFVVDNMDDPGIAYWLNEWFVPLMLAGCTEAQMAPRRADPFSRMVAGSSTDGERGLGCPT